MSVPKDPKLTYEQALARLEEITRLLEGRSLSLEESLKIFESGVSLCRFCLKKLEKAENRVEIILKNSEGKALTDSQGQPRTEPPGDADEFDSSSSSEEDHGRS